MEILEQAMAAPVRRHSELLAGMYEDLRAPIDSLLALARLLADNDGNHLTPQQVDFAQTIYAAGTDLLSLVDDIVDFARIEAQQTVPEVADQPFRELRAWLLRAFRQAASERHAGFEVILAPDLPAALRTDGKRLRHLLKNLLALAFRSAWGGQVALAVAAGAGAAVFEVRRQGGEALGGQHAGAAVLSLCRELAHALGGEVQAASLEAEDLRVALRLPLVPAPGQSPVPHVFPRRADGGAPIAPAPPLAARPPLRGADDPVTLIAEGNAQVAAVMLDLVRANGYQGAVASDLGTLRLLLRELAPEAVLIGGSLTDIDGWTVLELLRRDPRTRRLPVALNCFDGRRYVSLHTGARADWAGVPPARLAATLDAAAGRRAARLLLAGVPAEACGGDVAHWLDGREVRCVADGAAALDALRRDGADALAIGPALGGMGAVELVRAVGAAGHGPADLALAFLECPSDAALLEIAVLRSRARLEDVLGETALHLAMALGSRTPAAGAVLRREASSGLAGRTVLIVDDDIYNVYAMTGALEQQGMNAALAAGAREAIALLRDGADIDAVLIDITMPEIDGDSVVHALRAAHKGPLPIIAVTPHAMPGDREKCIGTGASDYIAKPVNVEQLLALLRTWIPRHR